MGRCDELQTVVIPYVYTNWPWPRNLSEHYADTKTECNAWLESFKPFTPETFKCFTEYDYNLLAALAYSPREKPLIRLACDLMTLISAYDDCSDLEDGDGAQKMQDMIEDVIVNLDKPRLEGEMFLGALFQSFVKNFSAHAGPDVACIQRFIRSWETYIKGITHEARDRTAMRYRTFADAIWHRGQSSGVYPCFLLLECGLNLPEEVHYDPMVTSLRDRGMQLLVIVNDFYSYAREKSRGEASYNTVELIMREKGITLQESFNWLGQYVEGIMASFMADLAVLPSWGPEVDARVRIYFDGIGQWVRGNYDWCTQTPRYRGCGRWSLKETPSGYVVEVASGLYSVQPTTN